MRFNYHDPNRMKPNDLRVQWTLLYKELELKEAVFTERGQELKKASIQLA